MRAKPFGTISVAMCTYNGERYLKEQLESIASQTMLPCELIACDDGSSDSTVNIITAFTRHAPFKVRLVRNRHTLGSTKNFEQAISLCTGELTALCDQDDWWSPAKLATLAKALFESGAGGIFSDGLLMDKNSRLTGDRLWHSFQFDSKNGAFSGTSDDDAGISMLLRHTVVTGATLMFQSVLREHMLPFPNEWMHDSWLAWMLALHSRLQAFPEPLIQYRVHEAQQAGVTPRSIWERIKMSRSTGLIEYRKMEQQFGVLTKYASTHPDICGPGILQQIREKHSHEVFRAELYQSHTNGLSRLARILTEARNYSLYSEGLRSMLKDGLCAGSS